MASAIAAGLEAFAAAGGGAGLRADGQGAIASGWGACRALFGEEPQRLVGRPLRALLPGAEVVLEAPGGTFEAALGGRRLLVVWARADEEAWLLAFDRGDQGTSLPADLAGAAAHDLRNPLATVKLNLQAIARDASGERGARRIGIALREIGSLERSLEALAECGRSVAPGEASPAAVAQAVRVACERELAEGSFTLELRIGDGLPACRAEGGRLALALANLVRAAGRTAPGSEVLLAAELSGSMIRWTAQVEAMPAPRSRSLAGALAQRVAADCQGRFAVEGPERASAFALYVPTGATMDVG